MFQYAFELGREYDLSIAETAAMLIKESGGFKVTACSNEIFLVELKNEIPENLLDRMGGIIKIIKIQDKFQNPEKYIKKVSDSIETDKGKLHFAVNIFHADKCNVEVAEDSAADNYNDFFSRTLINIFNSCHFQTHTNMTSRDKLFLKKSLKEIKNKLKNKGISSRFINKQGENARSIAILKEHLENSGTDFNIISTGKEFYCGETISVQNSDLYSRRDYGRPARDSRSGMLPPKLAQIMINISDNGKIYDAFCGSGTVLMESLLMGMDVIGSDISKKAIEDSEKNIKWLIKNFKSNNKYKLFLKDARKIDSETIGKNKVSIVSEFFLGSPDINSIDMAVKEINNVDKLLIECLSNWKRFEKQIRSIVLALPFYEVGNKRIFLKNLVEKIENLGYSVSDLNPNAKNKRKTLLYKRKKQTVGREIIRIVSLK